MSDDEELVRMACFKLKDAARRIATLAERADTPRIKTELMAKSMQLEELAQETQVLLGRCLGADTET